LPPEAPPHVVAGCPEPRAGRRQAQRPKIAGQRQRGSRSTKAKPIEAAFAMLIAAAPWASAEKFGRRIFREALGFRSCDGPSELHRRSLAQKLVKAGAN